MQLTRKSFVGTLVAVALLWVVYWLIWPLIGGVDDWEYSHVSSNAYIALGTTYGPWIVLIWLASSVFLIARGRSLERKGQRSALRNIGYALLSAPFLLILAGVAGLFAFPSVGGLAWLFPVGLLGLLVYGTVSATRRGKSFIAVPILSIVLALVVVGAGGALWLSLTPGRDAMQSQPSPMAAAAPEETLGFAVGGAKDIDNFRENLENDYLPLPTDLTYEGLFYDYYFDTGATEPCLKLFCPTYSYAISTDPFSGEEDYYLSVGLNSGIEESQFERKNLNLVVVLDISGSMGSAFNQYYYDQYGERRELDTIEGDEEDRDKSKMQVAAESIVALLDHLTADDRLGIVLFDNDAYLAKPLGLVGRTDMGAIAGHILEIEPRGGTNMEAGMRLGTEVFDEYLDIDPAVYENRMISLTDAMPNLGALSEEGLLGISQGNADRGVYATFIGVGIDFNSELVEAITKIRGANYYSVHSGRQFRERMDDEFELMVTPLVFNLLLELDAEGFEIEKVYGSPEANEATGEIMKVNTLFPSRRVEEETRGGLVLLKLERLSADASIRLAVSYEDRLGEVGGDVTDVVIDGQAAEYHANTGIRKGVLLSRYADLMIHWLVDERSAHQEMTPVTPAISLETGIFPPDSVQLGQWERQSIPLQVAEEYRELFSRFIPYFEDEMRAVGDETLSKEVDTLKKLSAPAASPPAASH